MATLNKSILDFSTASNGKYGSPRVHALNDSPSLSVAAPLAGLWEGHGDMPKGSRKRALRAGVMADRLARVATRLVRVDNPDAGLDISFLYDSTQLQSRTNLINVQSRPTPLR